MWPRNNQESAQSFDQGSDQRKKRLRVLWLRPTVGTHISTRRERIREGLAERDISVDIVDTSGTDIINAVQIGLKKKYDIIVGTVRVGLYYGYLLSRLKGVPFIAEVTEPINRIKNDIPRPFFASLKRFEWEILTRADARFFVEAEVLNRAQSRGIEGNLARNSVWYEKFADPNSRVVEAARKQLELRGVDFDSPSAIYVGGFTRQQHIPEILGAVPECPKWEFLFLGEDGKHADAVIEAAKNMENAYFLGSVPHEKVPGYLSFADVGFSLSSGERPLKLLEYGAAGLTVLGIPGRRQNILSDDEVCYISPTSERIAEILNTLHTAPDQIPATGPALQEYAEKNSWDDIAEMYCNVFRDLVNRF
jgi:glycosyltransferase involved in cell wall biosynthesis